MTSREKTLAKIFVPALALGAAYALAVKVVLPPFISVRTERDDLVIERDELDKKIAEARKALGRYQKLCSLVPLEQTPGQPLASDDDRARQYLKEHVRQLMEASGLQLGKEDQPTVEAGKGRRDKKELDKIVYRIEAHGDLRTVLQVMVEVYRSNDLVVLADLDIDPDNKVFDDHVTAKLRFEMPVIPRENKLLKLAAANGANQPAEGQGAEGYDGAETTVVQARLAQSDYERLLGWRPFAPHKEVQVASQNAGETTRPPEPPPPPPDQSQSDRHNLVIRASFNDEILVVRKNGAAKPTGRWDHENPDRRYFKVGQEFDGGKLELVHHLGVVVSKKEGEDKPAQDWIYQFDQTLADCKLLDDIVQEQSEFRQIQLVIQKRTPASTDAAPTGEVEAHEVEDAPPADQPVEPDAGGDVQPAAQEEDNAQEEPCDEQESE